MQVQEQTRLKDTEPLAKKKLHLHWEVVALFAITLTLVFLIAVILRTVSTGGTKNLADLPSMSVSFRPVKNAGVVNLVATASASTPARLYAFFSLKDNATLLYPDRHRLDSIQQAPVSFVLTPDLVQAARSKQGFLFVVVVKPNVSLLTRDDLSQAPETEKPLVGEAVYRKLKEMTRSGDAETQRVELPDPVTAFLPPPPKARPVAAQAPRRVVPTARTSAPGTLNSAQSTATGRNLQLPGVPGRSAVLRRVVTQTRPPIDAEDDDLPVDGNYGQVQGQRVTGQQIQKQRI